MRWLLVERPYVDADSGGNVEDAVQCVCLSFDGGSLICFDDEDMRVVKVAFGPGGWLRARWAEDGDVQV
ncbi:hypothetical protein [Corynebacterium callunae]|uniref:Uncharacterized protein n=1 Tax=Corynebacterium callunae DSM 20147 TaxID=1121353 RepID=M1ULC6_9CORY|nr:hypothetical protein [Corynebacterium callunae]AGG66879.1 hypothetical protein H924_07185 [Corynebacterium callunae DSM 20147]MCK2200182.1 hypothetical protein [Corynebacterium callunae]